MPYRVRRREYEFSAQRNSHWSDFYPSLIWLIAVVEEFGDYEEPPVAKFMRHQPQKALSRSKSNSQLVAIWKYEFRNVVGLVSQVRSPKQKYDNQTFITKVAF